MIDSHAHIHDPLFDTDREGVLERARVAGVTNILTIGTSVRESYEALELAKQYPDIIRATVAVHPYEYSGLPDENIRLEWKQEISALSQDSCVVGIGECGLDYHAFGEIPITQKQRDAQKQGFLDHIEIAISVQKPLIVHARESYDDVCEILGGHIQKLPSVVLHCYQGDAEITKQFLELSENILFSFAGNCTYPIAKKKQGTKDDIRKSIAIIPVERMLIETDCPYLAPQKYRGNRNEPSYVAETARFLAQEKNFEYEKFVSLTAENTRKIFSL